MHDPALIVRAQGSFPAVGELLEPFSNPFLVEGWMRGSHHGPMMPCAFEDANPSRFDGPPRVIAAGFQLANGKLVGPRDMFDDPSFDAARQKANVIADYMRSHGPFEPHRLPLEEIPFPNIISSSTFLKGGATLFFTTFTRIRFPVASSVPLAIVSILRTSRRTVE